jgi:hypothetical protein
MPKRRYEINGRSWVPITQAAKLIGTNALGVHKLIEDGKLSHRHSRAGSAIVVVDLMQVANLRAEREQWRKERQPKKAKLPPTSATYSAPPEEQRIPGHREQMALPMADAGRSPPWRRGR